MALYLGDSEKLKFYINGVKYKLNLYSEVIKPNIDGIMLLSSDGFILQDVNGLYLTTKESD